MKNERFAVRRRWLAVWAAALLGAFLWWQNHGLMIAEISVPAEVEAGIRILHLSDVHGAWFGPGQVGIAEKARMLRPDVIVITGDFVDRRCDERPAVALIEQMAEIAPTYCVTGNHEELERLAGTGTYEQLSEAVGEMERAHFLHGETVWLTDEISLTGADDVPFAGGMASYPGYIGALGESAEGDCRILLAHRPEMFDAYAEAGFDLTLSGHAHGGQIRLPFLGGLYAPGQGILPEYDSGLYEAEDGTKMHVSRGLGNSVFPLRMFNRPEMTVIEIRPEE